MDSQIKKIVYFPMLVPSTGENRPMSHEENQDVWKKFYTTSQKLQDTITDEQIPLKIFELQKKFGLSEPVVGAVSLHIRKIFFSEISVSDAEVSLKKSLATNNDNDNKAKEIVQFIQNEILTIKPKPKVEEVPVEPQKAPVLVKLPLLQALSKYEQLGSQQITQERISVKSQSEPVRPSLLYWIKYYRDELGIGHHDSVQRGNFLFRSENGKRLSSEERERVNLVLKSIEENYPLDIDTERSEIIFPRFEMPREGSQLQSAAASQSLSNAAFNFGKGGMAGGEKSGGALSFTSKHVFPAEKNPALGNVPVAPVTPKPQMPTSVPAAAPKANPFRIRPVSLGKE